MKRCKRKQVFYGKGTSNRSQLWNKDKASLEGNALDINDRISINGNPNTSSKPLA